MFIASSFFPFFFFLSRQTIFPPMACFMTKGTLISDSSTSQFSSRILSIVFHPFFFLHSSSFAHPSFKWCLFGIFIIILNLQISQYYANIFEDNHAFTHNNVVIKWLYSSGNKCRKILALTLSLISSSRFLKFWYMLVHWHFRLHSESTHLVLFLKVPHRIVTHSSSLN